METKASSKYIRVSPRKARLVTDLIKGKDVADAQQILDYSPKAAARVVSKILNSAVANAEHNNGLNPDELFVSRAYVDEGPTLKRFQPRALGRATRINKRTSHITLVLDEREPRGEAKRRRFRRRPKPAVAEEPEELTEGELEEELEEPEAQRGAPKALRAEDTKAELNADTAPEAQRAEAEEEELNADVTAEEPEQDEDDEKSEE